MYVLITFAATYGAGKALGRANMHEATLEDYDGMFDTNVKGTYVGWTELWGGRVCTEWTPSGMILFFYGRT